jgi:hypothetical protein
VVGPPGPGGTPTRAELQRGYHPPDDPVERLGVGDN